MKPMTINEYLKHTKTSVKGHDFTPRPRVVCQDGFTISVQAGEYLYSSPRTNSAIAYSHVECGFPSERPPAEWGEYSEEEWQRPGLFGSIARIFKKRSHLWFAFTHGFKCKSFRYFRELVSFKDNATKTVYPYTPVELVDKLLELHGGIDLLASAHPETSRTIEEIAKEFEAAEKRLGISKK